MIVITLKSGNRYLLSDEPSYDHRGYTLVSAQFIYTRDRDGMRTAKKCNLSFHCDSIESMEVYPK